MDIYIKKIKHYSHKHIKIKKKQLLPSFLRLQQYLQARHNKKNRPARLYPSRT